jgi:DtxR family Mn-dependent transcriptional regulator
MDSPGARRRRGLKPLDEVTPGEPMSVISVFERDRKLLEYLDRVGVRPGANVEVIAVGDEFQISADGAASQINRAAAGRVWVARANGPGMPAMAPAKTE